MPAIYHVKEVDDTFEGAVTRVTESTSPDDVVWHCQKVDSNYDGAIFYIKWAEQNFTGPIQRVVGIARMIEIVIHGTSPISLPDAIANSLEYVKAFGGTELQSLPAGYTELEYIGFDGDQYLTTNYYPNVNTELDVTYYPSVATRFMAICGTQDSGSANRYYAAVASNQFFIQVCAASYNNYWSVLSNGTYRRGSVSDITALQEVVHLTMNKTKTHVFTNSTGAVDVDMSTDSEWGHNINCSYPFMIGARSAAGVAGNTFIGNIYRTVLKENNRIVFNGIPCKNSSDVIGMYDTVSGTFLTNQGTGNLTAGPAVTEPAPTAPTNILCNNGVLKYGYKSVNMFDKNNTLANGTVWLIGGDTTSLANYYGTNQIHVIGGHTYTRNGSHGSANYIKLSDGTWVNQSDGSATITMPNNAVLWVFNNTTATSRDTMMVVEGTSLPAEYVPYGGYGIYTDGTVETIKDTLNNTATCEYLLAIASSKDAQSIIDGRISRAVGIKVLDGTENWVGTTAAGITWYMADILDNNMFSHLICTHFQNQAPMLSDNSIYKSAGSSVLQIRYDDVADLTAFKAWLASQYAVGTPVMVLYGLATPTTETVTGQTLQVQAGDNTLEITQASLTGLELEAKYQAAVTLTIQEVQDANLDPNVQVTIN